MPVYPRGLWAIRVAAPGTTGSRRGPHPGSSRRDPDQAVLVHGPSAGPASAGVDRPPAGWHGLDGRLRVFPDGSLSSDRKYKWKENGEEIGVEKLSGGACSENARFGFESERMFAEFS
jgi:hypothetical protein